MNIVKDNSFYKVIFDKTIDNAGEIDNISRYGTQGGQVAIALLLLAFTKWTPQNQSLCYEMCDKVINSPTHKDNLNEVSKQFIKDRMLQNDKWRYIGTSYFDGANPENSYIPDIPLCVRISEHPYSSSPSEIFGLSVIVYYYYVKSSGADTPRSIGVYKDPQDDKWYIWSASWKGLLADVRHIR